jgi:hypothetical protein
LAANRFKIYANAAAKAIKPKANAPQRKPASTGEHTRV